ncbi:MAG: bifunctional UDP-N-acetylglucosamine diphosphorylase/glucosamine-1-phosphate N-acetyltransferase GlmU [Rhodospirillales bacterium]|jgi:bifunctional UDP-N-acetylglucosamine pyrophosphorylase/glucosamine-1-phosphate N-acetyltransferase|nr:bifunctional UDP-N-acetylglucosamine diphosphorylase/glucosamine-1-phosphate N-acetyltransferase GlmU [Rhodospirillales bacterium]MDP6772742.1 bifunctional UDP-N-acetylglucosamine diphosphorylase/glucosamine-1-phosphate N-acetyltransferase GlmU [Rhodospirillales bacterium]
MTKTKSVAGSAAIVLAAGLGTRMESDVPKVLHGLAGRPMIAHLMASLAEAGVGRAVVVVGPGPGAEAVAEAVAPHTTAVQAEQLGTGDAVLAAKGALADFSGDVLILNGDAPLITPETMERVLAARRSAPHPGLVVLGFRTDAPGAYGRLITGADGALEAIVEAGDASPDELAVDLCNSGVMAVDGERLFGLLQRLGNDNAKGEYYLTDIVALGRADGLASAVVEGAPSELMGINSRAELAAAEAVAQDRLRQRAMAGGATLLDPRTVYLGFDTRLGRDVTVGPHVVFGPGVEVGDGAEILAFSHLEGAHVGAGVRVGPFARLRPGARIAAEAHIGNFVEIKNASVEAGAKINHLTYVGDARVGAGANVGAGTITCNYDGIDKHFTDIGAGAFIGSNTALVAPVRIGDGAMIGAGSVITKDVAADALAVTRSDQKEIDGAAARFRQRQAKGGGAPKRKPKKRPKAKRGG